MPQDSEIFNLVNDTLHVAHEINNRRFDRLVLTPSATVDRFIGLIFILLKMSKTLLIDKVEQIKRRLEININRIDIPGIQLIIVRKI